MSSILGNPKVYPTQAGATEDMPLSLVSASGLPRAIGSAVKTVVLSSASGDQQSANGSIRWSLPTGPAAGWIKPYSMYVRCNIKLAGMPAASTFVFSGPGSGAGIAVAEPDAPGNGASSIIRRLVVSCGQPIDVLDDAWMYADLLNAHASSADYQRRDRKVYELVNTTITKATAEGDGVDVIIPVLSSTFNSSRAFPAWLAQSLELQLDLRPVRQALIFSAAAADAEYTVRQAQLVYETISVDQAVMQATMATLADPMASYQLPLHQAMVIRGPSLAVGSNISHTIALSLSSVRGVLYAQNQPAAVGGNASRDLVRTGMTSFTFYNDGLQGFGGQQNKTPVQFAESQRVLNALFDTNVVSLCGSVADYTGKYFVAGQSYLKFSEGDALLYCGTPIRNLQLVTEGAAQEAVDTYFIVLYDSMLSFNSAGAARIEK